MSSGQQLGKKDTPVFTGVAHRNAGGFKTTFVAHPSLAADQQLILPDGHGSANQVLTDLDGNGTLGFQTASSLIPVATQAEDGLLTAADKIKLDGMQEFLTTVTQSSTSNSYANINQLVATLQPGTYRFTFNGLFQSASTGTGIGLRVGAGTATITTCYGQWFIGQAGDGTAQSFQYSQLTANTNVTSTSVATANSNAIAHATGVFVVTVAGTVAIQIRSEQNGTAVTIQPGCVFTLNKV
jgi:hypothetical protein